MQMTDTQNEKSGLQVLTFKLGEEVFGVDIMRVREVIDYTRITRMPQSPEFMRGIINLRGNVVPVIDIKRKFGMGVTEKTVNTCIIIVEVAGDDDGMVLGALADSVQEVVEFEAKNIEDAPKIGTHLNTAFIHGMAKKDDEFVIILDVDRVFSPEELNLLTQVEAA